jgi:hypothetical protein
VIRALRRGNEEVFVVKLPQGLQIAVPGWMLDAIHCGRLPQEARPRVALAALLELAALLNIQRLHFSASRPNSEASPHPETADARATKNSLSANQPGLSQEGPLGEVSRSQSNPVRRTADTAVARGGVNPSSTREEL